MFKSLYFKVVLILLIFIVAVMCAVGAILLNGVTSYYEEDFVRQMNNSFTEDGLLMSELKSVSSSDNYPYEMKRILNSYAVDLGIDQYRNYYILDSDGELITGSDAELGSELGITPNMLNIISQKSSNDVKRTSEYADWAIRIPIGEDGEDYTIIYVRDSLEEMRSMNGMLFSIVLQAMLLGIIIAVILSFFLAKSISSPIQTLTQGTQKVAEGEFSGEINVHSSDEIGVLAENFNNMKERLKNTIDEVEGEKEKLDTVLSYMSDALVAFTESGELLHLNGSAAKIFADAIKEGDLTPEKCAEMLDLPQDINNAAEQNEKDNQNGLIFRDRICNGRVYDVSYARIRDSEDSDTYAGSVFIIHDVTGRYELDESRREFVANVSHELRTPLTSIKGATETVRMDPDMEADVRDYFLDMVLSESDRMTRIVSDLLVLSRLDNKRTKWNIETFDFKQSVRRLCDVMRPEFGEKNHEVSFGAEVDIPLITADKQRIEQVIVNIISNAIKYTPEGGHIDLKVSSTKSNTVVLQITDNGIGIPEDDLSHLFERFYRVEKSRSQDAGGTGLGLAIAKEIIEAHGGNISISSKLNVGTSVRIELPVECHLNVETNEKEDKK